MEKKKKLTGQQGELMRALDITVDDLLANDDGFVTENQQNTVPKRQAYQWRQFIILPSVFSVVAVLMLGLTIVEPESTLVLAFMSLFFMLAATSIGGFGWFTRQKVKNELSSNQIETVQGIAVVVSSSTESYIEINGLKLNASPDIVRRVQHLQPYIIHYLPGSKIILSMEHIDEDDNIRESSARLEDNDSTGDTLDYGNDESARYSGSQS